MNKNLNAGVVAAAVLVFTSLVAGAAEPGAKDTRPSREAHEKYLYEKREAEAKASAKGDSAKGDKPKELTGAEQKALATKAREDYEQSVRDKKAAAVAADKAARAEKAAKAARTDQQLTEEERRAKREQYEQSVREKSGKGDMKADAKGDMKAAAKARGEKIDRAPVVDPATRAAEESWVRKNPAEAAEPPKKPK